MANSQRKEQKGNEKISQSTENRKSQRQTEKRLKRQNRKSKGKLRTRPTDNDERHACKISGTGRPKRTRFLFFFFLYFVHPDQRFNNNNNNNNNSKIDDDDSLWFVGGLCLFCVFFLFSFLVGFTCPHLSERFRPQPARASFVGFVFFRSSVAPSSAFVANYMANCRHFSRVFLAPPPLLRKPPKKNARWICAPARARSCACVCVCVF